MSECPPGCECGRHPGLRKRTCLPDCTCGRHKRTVRPKCAPGCTCKRHEYVWREEWKAPNNSKECLEGCQCGKHDKHPAGCPCGRHTRQGTAEISASRKRSYAKRRLEIHERQYGLSAGELTRRFEDQQGRCYACGKLISLTDARGYAIDHDHSCCPGTKACGKCVLGLTCGNCNRGFGQFDDDPVLMVQAASRRMERMKALSVRSL